MIRGLYLNPHSDDISECLNIRQIVYREEYNIDLPVENKDRYALHIILYNNEDKPVGTARLLYDIDGDFGIDYLAVLKEYRNDRIADFIMHMIIDKAATSGALRLLSSDITHCAGYFERYGFIIKDGKLVLDLREYFKNHKCCGD